MSHIHFSRQECWWYFQLTSNSCSWVMCLMEAETPACFYFLWLQPRKGNTSNRWSLPSDAKPSSQTFLGFLQQNMARYSSSLVSMGKTQFGLGTTGSMAGILQVSTFQLEALYLIMGGKRKQKRLISTWECIYSWLLLSHYKDNVFGYWFTYLHLNCHIQLYVIM